MHVAATFEYSLELIVVWILARQKLNQSNSKLWRANDLFDLIYWFSSWHQQKLENVLYLLLSLRCEKPQKGNFELTSDFDYSNCKCIWCCSLRECLTALETSFFTTQSIAAYFLCKVAAVQSLLSQFLQSACRLLNFGVNLVFWECVGDGLEQAYPFSSMIFNLFSTID